MTQPVPVTASELNEFLYDKFFKNDVRDLLEYMQGAAQAYSVDIEHVCIGVGYKESVEKNSSSFLYLHDPKSGYFKKKYDYGFEYPRIKSWGLEHYRNEHKYWLTYADIVQLCEDTAKAEKSTDQAQG